jgi:nitrite reductase (NO-forming)
MSSIISRRELFSVLGTGVALLGIGATSAIAASGSESSGMAAPTAAFVPPGRGVVAEPTHIPPPIKRDHSIHHEVTFEGREVDAEVEPGAKFSYMTFNCQVPGPMIRVRQRDTVTLTLRKVITTQPINPLAEEAEQCFCTAIEIARLGSSRSG